MVAQEILKMVLNQEFVPLMPNALPLTIVKSPAVRQSDSEIVNYA